jgi:SNW domain-containing protein 1
MASALLSSIPAPSKEYTRPEAPPTTSAALVASRVTREPPPYGKRQGFVPRRLEDYGDGERWASGGGAPCLAPARSSW